MQTTYPVRNCTKCRSRNLIQQPPRNANTNTILATWTTTQEHFVTSCSYDKFFTFVTPCFRYQQNIKITTVQFLLQNGLDGISFEICWCYGYMDGVCFAPGPPQNFDTWFSKTWRDIDAGTSRGILSFTRLTTGVVNTWNTMVSNYGEANVCKRTGVGLKLTMLQRNVGQKWLDCIVTGQVTTHHPFGRSFAGGPSQRTNTQWQERLSPAVQNHIVDRVITRVALCQLASE